MITTIKGFLCNVFSLKVLKSTLKSMILSEARVGQDSALFLLINSRKILHIQRIVSFSRMMISFDDVSSNIGNKLSSTVARDY